MVGGERDGKSDTLACNCIVKMETWQYHRSFAIMTLTTFKEKQMLRVFVKSELTCQVQKLL